MSVLVVIPTLDEAPTLPAVLAGLGDAPIDAVLVVDDGSTDGTPAIARACGAAVLERSDRGYAGACFAGFKWGLERGFARIVQMDADGSHAPGDVANLVGADADVVVGSRYVAGGTTPGWPLGRRLLSRGAGAWVRATTRLPLADPTAGFRCWRAAPLRAVCAREPGVHGYAVQIELAHRAWRAGFSFAEVPVTFRDRAGGASKLSWRICAEAALAVPRLSWR